MKLSQSIVKITISDSTGAGIIVSPNFILTTENLFTSSNKAFDEAIDQSVFEMQTSRGWRELEVELIKKNETYRLVLFKIVDEFKYNISPIIFTTCEYLNNPFVSVFYNIREEENRKSNPWIHCEIHELNKIKNDFNLINRFGKNKIIYGLSGAPIIHDKTNQIIGLTQKTSDSDSNIKFFAKGISSDIICSTFPEILLRDHSSSERKIIVLGDPGVGKTTLIAKLIDPTNRLRRNEKSTKGLEITSVHLDEPKVKANFWDFGGQKIYHSLYQLFFSDQTIYIIVFDDSSEITNLEYWTNQIELFSENCPVLLVRNRKGEEKNIRINIGKLRNTYPSITDYVEVDLKSNFGFDKLDSRLKDTLAEKPRGIKDPISESWRKCKRAIENLAKEKAIISYTEFQDICKASGGIKKEEEILVFSKYLHDVGVILHFQDNSHLFEVIILQPNWLTKAIYQILDSKKLNDREGRFISYKDLRSTLRLKEHKRYLNEIIEIMCHSYLCYKVKSNFLIFPQLLSKDNPEYTWEPEDNLIVIFEYSFLPSSVLARLIINMTTYIEKDKLIWRNGVIFRKGTTRAEVIQKPESRRITAKLSGTDKKSLLTIIQSELDQIHAEYKSLEVEALVPCNCKECSSNKSPYLYPYESLEKRLMKGKLFIECPVSYSDISVISLIDDDIRQKNIVHSSNISAGGNVHIGDKIKFPSKAKPDYDVFISYSIEDSKEVIEVAQILKEEGVELWIDQWHLSPGTSISQEIQRQINNSKTIAVFIGKESVKSNWLRKEVQNAQRLNKKIIPVLFPDVNANSIPEEVSSLHYIRLRENSVEPIDDLIFGITGVRSQNLQLRTNTKKIRDLIAHSEIDKAMKALLSMRDYLSNKSIIDQIILLASQYNDISSKLKSGSITSDEEWNTKSKILSRSLETLKIIEEENTQNRKKNLQQIIEDNPNDLDAWRELAKIYELTGEKEKAKEATKTYKELEDKKDFIRNTNNPALIYHLQLQETGFFDSIDWNLRPRVNVLLGRNGYGKSQLFRIMIGVMMKDNKVMNSFFQNKKPNAKIELGYLQNNRKVETLRRALGYEYGIGRVPVLAIPDTRFINKSSSKISLIEDDKDNLSEAGGYHFLHQKPYEATIQNFLYGLCNDYLEEGQSFKAPIFNLLEQAVQELTGSDFKFHQINRIGNIEFEILIRTEGNYDQPLPIQMASQGTLSILTIVGLIYNFLRSLYPKVELSEITNRHGIVFIDEVDAHLHPVWQQKIMRLLRKAFPNIQFIVSAHSPLIVAGCKEKEVAVLRKTENGFAVGQLENDFIGWKTEEIFDLVFEVEEKDSTFLEYGRKASKHKAIKEEIKTLEDKPDLTREEEEYLEKLIEEEKGIQQYKLMNEKRWNEENIEEVNQELREKILLMEDELEELKKKLKDG